MKKKLLLLLIIICIIFIFFNSLMNANQSIEESSRITKAIEKVVDTLYKGNTPEKVAYFFKTNFNNILRDFAHFLEFFILGILTMLYSDKLKITFFRKFCFAVLFCSIIALIDETIQIFSPGREFEFSDLVLDDSGSIIGITLILLLRKIKKRRYGGISG